MGRFSDVRNVTGVYLLLDLDERPLYAGQSRHVRSRLEQHFVRQDSSATADGLLDIYDVLRVVVWYVYPKYELCAEEDDSVQ
jgi:excinuclease UvrABC nuclease subunit